MSKALLHVQTDGKLAARSIRMNSSRTLSPRQQPQLCSPEMGVSGCFYSKNPVAPARSATCRSHASRVCRVV